MLASLLILKKYAEQEMEGDPMTKQLSPSPKCSLIVF